MASDIKLSANFKRNYVALFAISLFFLIVIAEIFIAISVPRFLSRENTMANEVNRLKFVLFFDQTRRLTNSISSNDEIIIMEKEMINAALDHLALYLRKEADYLTPEEVTALDKSVRALHRVATILKSGKQFSGEYRLSTTGYVNSLLKEYAGGKK